MEWEGQTFCDLDDYYGDEYGINSPKYFNRQIHERSSYLGMRSPLFFSAGSLARELLLDICTE